MAKKLPTKSQQQSSLARIPVVTVLGHVDHGKTTLLDAIRQTNVAEGEHGGITQHIGAYQIVHKDFPITFLDTPGHAAFSAMRSRGARVADIVVLVVAADDGVKPQTKEAIAIAKEAKVPMIVAINKIDLPGANVEKVKRELAQEGVLVEGFGGDVVALPVSAKKKEGVTELLDMIRLVSEMQGLTADPQAPLEAVVIEARLDKHRGPVATAVVRDGSIKSGDFILIDGVSSKVRTLITDTGEQVKVAIAGMAVEILGLGQVPTVGAVVSLASAKKELTTVAPLPALDPFARLKNVPSPGTKEQKTVKVVLKCDVAGSLEAITQAFPAQVIIISATTGAVSAADVLLAAGSRGIIIGFNVAVPADVATLAEQEQVPIKVYHVIYELLEEIDDVVQALSAMLEKAKVHARAEIIAEFGSGKTRIAGCRMVEGSFTKGHTVVLIRGEQIIGQTKIASLRREKESVNQVKKDQEFGAIFGEALDFEVGDNLESHGKV